ncbi:hypothetical protein F4779DRAFT_616049 [Xylariaceae sp. FL0662B]|nr:hypothetical protein F4779DRAFT_616049 [Xylariaceae sp. FL0662B]
MASLGASISKVVVILICSRHFAVWAASPKAEFLHSRFLRVAWDVDEPKSEQVGKQPNGDLFFSKIGVKGLQRTDRTRLKPSPYEPSRRSIDNSYH